MIGRQQRLEMGHQRRSGETQRLHQANTFSIASTQASSAIGS